MSVNVSQSLRRRPQPKDIQFTVTEEERNQKIFTFKKLVSENFDFFPFKLLKLNYESSCRFI